MRFRVDGQAYEIDDLPKLKKTEKHDIDVVIDRLKVRPEVQQRLAESFEAALRLADGRAMALEMDSGKRAPVQRQVRLPDLPLLASANWSRACSPSTRRWAPARAATAWAHMEFFDPQRVVAFPTLSLAGGAIKGWDRRNALLLQPDRKPGASTTSSTSTRPSRSCRPQCSKALLHGSGEEEIRFTYVDGVGRLGGPQGDARSTPSKA